MESDLNKVLSDVDIVGYANPDTWDLGSLVTLDVPDCLLSVLASHMDDFLVENLRVNDNARR